MKTIVVSVNSGWNLLNFRSELLRRLVAEGYHVVALTPGEEYGDRLRAMGLEHVELAIDSQGISPVRDAALLFRYWRALRRLRPAVYLGWTIKPNIYGSLAAHLLGIPVINNISGLGTAFIRRGWLTRIASVLYRVALAKSSMVFFQNAADRALFVKRHLVEGEVATLLPGSGIDIDRFSCSASDQPVSPFIFLMIARLIRDKGTFEYVEAVSYVKARHTDVRFDILGQLDVANRTAITRAQVAEWVEAGIINHLGEADDVRPFIAEADCVVLPSYREGMPRSLLEAAAMGKPLIATDVPGCTEIARAGENAILCAPRDAKSLADAMCAMLDLPPARRAAMGQRSRRIAEAEFDVTIVERRYVEAIARAIY